jgi:hypothetical protein
MENRLAYAFTIILNHTESGLAISTLPGNISRFSENVPDQAIILLCHIETVYNMFFREHQQMQGRLWSYVLNNQELFIFKYFF